MFSAAIPVVEEIVFEDLWPYKREKKPSSKRGRGTQKQGKREQKQSKNPEKEIIHSEKKKGGTEEKKNPKTKQRPKKTQSKKKFTQRGESVLPLLLSLQKTTKTKSVSTEAGTFVRFLHYLKIC
jgi:hypothetical protein